MENFQLDFPIEKAKSASFEFLFHITRSTKIQSADRFFHSGDLRVQAFAEADGLIGIHAIFYETTDVLPLIDFLERIGGVPLFVPICEAARNAYESLIS